MSNGRPPENTSGGLLDSEPSSLTKYCRLRSDLIFSRHPAAGGDSYVVKDPVRAQFFRFKELECFIARQLDGATPVEEIRRRAAEKFNAALEPDELNRFIAALRANRLLETGQTGSSPPKGRQRRLRGNAFYLRFSIGDPDRLFNGLIGRIQFFFTPYFVALSAVTILAAVNVIVFNWTDFTGSLPQLFQLRSLPLIWLVLLFVTTAHEFAHGLTCKHFGGEVHELGFILFYLQPGLFCNVSDAWLFPEKSRRLWVSFAGPYFEFFLWGLATLAWWLTDPGTGINHVALAVTATSGFQTLFNFNPLIKLDGYYLLSDWLEIPNLRRRSYACIGAGIKRLFGKRTELEATPRERRFFWFYGLVVAVFSTWLLGYMVIKLAGFFVARNEGLPALAVALFLLTGRIRRRMLRFFPEESKELFRGLGRLFRALKRPAIVGGLLASMFAGAWFFRAELKVSGPIEVLPTRNADVRAQVDGICDRVFVDEGQPVRKGGLIAQLSDRDNLAQLRQTEDDIRAAQAKLLLLVNGPRPEEIAAASNEVAKADEQVQFAASTLARDRQLYRIKLVSQQEYEADQANLAVQRSTLAEAQNQLALLRAGSRPEDIAAAKGDLARLETQRAYLEEQINLAKVYSPADGIVVTPSRQLKEMVHQLVKKGDLIAKIYDLKTVEAATFVSEKEIADVKVGQPVELKVRAYPGLTFHGNVVSIGATTVGQTSSDLEVNGTPASPAGVMDAKMVLVTTRIDNGWLLLKPGMTGEAKILCGRRRILDLVNRRIARTFKVQFWSWW
ncbi:MAG: efflux RND transporter periplasmic adaptor subunit [Verrucomicrobiota bacterium]|nr:efflux RND transporter periplasmic adaptor subunit [Verrucomicrobiota bacterium]